MTVLRAFIFMPVMIILALPARAQEPMAFESGWYLGGGVSFSDVYAYDDQCWGCYGSAEYGNGDSAIALTAGLRATRALAIEATYIGKSTLRWNENVLLFDDFFEPYVVDSTIDMSSYQISVIGILAGRVWEGYLRVGMALWDAESSQWLTNVATGATVPRSFDGSGEDLLIGVGIGRNFSDGWQARLDYAFFPIDDEILALSDPYEAYADYLTLQIVKRFGRR
jgi:hypothetical protein